MRLRLRFSSCLGRVSFSTGKSILPRIFGPSSLSALMFSITGGASSTGSSAIISGFTSSTTGSTTSSFLPFFFAGFFSSFASIFSSFFFDSFLGLVEESIVERSILLITLGPSSSGISVFTSSGSATGCSTTTGGAGASSFGSSFFTGFFSSFSFLKIISSSSFFFLRSAATPLGKSIRSLFSLATLSL